MSPDSPRLIERAWGAAAATTILVAFVAAGALFSDAPGDRAGGARFAVLLALGLLAAMLARLRRRSMIWILFGMSLGQIAVAGLLLAQGIGAPRVVAALTVIFATGWAAAASLMLAADRQGS